MYKARRHGSSLNKQSGNFDQAFFDWMAGMDHLKHPKKHPKTEKERNT